MHHERKYYKTLLLDSLPTYVESHLDPFSPDHLNAKIVVRTIENKQDVVHYLPWAFIYCLLTLNPSYYNLQGTIQRHLADHISELVETTIFDLETSKCIAIEDDMYISPFCSFSLIL